MTGLVTRCPACSTAFRVVADQLRLRAGKVRCGICHEVFDARAHAVEPAAPPLTVPAIVPGLPERESASTPYVPRPAATPPGRPAASGAGRGVPVADAAAPRLPPAIARPGQPAGFGSTPTAPVRYPRTEPGFGSAAASRPAAAASNRREPAWTTDGSAGLTHGEPRFGARHAAASVPGARAERHVEPTLTPPAAATPDDAPTIVARDDDGFEPGFAPHAARRHHTPGFNARDDEAEPDIEPGFGQPAERRSDRDHLHAHAVAGHTDADEADDVDAVEVERKGVFATAETRWNASLAALRRNGGRTERRPVMQRVWRWATVAAVVLALFQAAWWWRTPLATHVPGTRPALQAMCNLFGCEVGHVRAPRRLSIESSSVQPDTSQPGNDLAQRLVLEAVLRNRAEHDQPWPSMEVSLTDFSDTVVIRRVLPPEAYLPGGLTERPFAAGGEQRIAVALDTRGAPITGYRLALFFP